MEHHSLKTARILFVGMGALGCRTARILVGRGALRITLCDFDIVERGNLATQPLYDEEDIGKKKVHAARERLSSISPDCDITIIDEPFFDAAQIDHDIAIIVDGTDSLAVKDALNDAARRRGIPLVVGVVGEDEGMAFSHPGKDDGPCWRCITTGKESEGGCSIDTLSEILDAVAEDEARRAVDSIEGPSGAGSTLTVFSLSESILKKSNIIVKRNKACPSCKGDISERGDATRYRFCQGRDALVARSAVPRLVDFDALRSTYDVIEDYGSAVRIRIDGGNVLVHRHGAMEFHGVDETAARRFARGICPSRSDG